LDAPGNAILKNDFGFLSSFVLFKSSFYQLKTMLRAGFFTNAARITGLLSKKELIRVLFASWVNHQSFCRTIDRTKGATRAFFLIDEQHPVIIEQEPL
jgi:hypothetical protein